MSEEIIENELSYKIMRAAFEVHNQLGPGFLKNSYEEAMTLELRAQEMHSSIRPIRVESLFWSH